MIFTLPPTQSFPTPLPYPDPCMGTHLPVAGKFNDVTVLSNFKSNIGVIVVEKELFSVKIPTYGTGNPITGIQS